MKALACLTAGLLASCMLLPPPAARSRAENRIDVSSLLDTVYCRGYPRCRGLFEDSVYVMADQACAPDVRSSAATAKVRYRVIPYGNVREAVRPGHPYTLIQLQTLKKDHDQLVLRLSTANYTGGPPHPQIGDIGVEIGYDQVRLRRVKHRYIYQETVHQEREASK